MRYAENMLLSRNLLSAISIGLVLGYALLSGTWVSTGDAWYRALRQPAWQPPDVVFGLIWPYNFIVLGIAGFVVTQRASTQVGLAWNFVLLISVIAAITWAYQFYVPHHLLIAAVSLLIGALSTIGLLIIIWPQSTLLFWLLIPYQLWLLTATSLSFGYWHLN